ncbi:hypothetical protein ANN_04121 [Periplaneta americana]|uniref:Uncharacterized protein n=1 Tax=Periplaneta americana TaxID=6978 RepID=A0ABQ8T990_PERAM|nr:hypothetical protein ANN_04121 [Periplaneta americana]
MDGRPVRATFAVSFRSERNAETHIFQLSDMIVHRCHKLQVIIDDNGMHFYHGLPRLLLTITVQAWMNPSDYDRFQDERTIERNTMWIASVAFHRCGDGYVILEKNTLKTRNSEAKESYLASERNKGDNSGEMSPGSSTESYPAFARIGLRENPGKNSTRNIKTRRLRWAGHVARMRESRNAYRVLVGRPEGKRPLGRPRRRWEDNIKMDLREVGYDDREWINLAQDRDLWRAYVRAAGSLKASDNTDEMSPESSTESYPAFAHIGFREKSQKNLNQICTLQKNQGRDFLSLLKTAQSRLNWGEDSGALQRATAELGEDSGTKKKLRLEERRRRCEEEIVKENSMERRGMEVERDHYGKKMDDGRRGNKKI